MVSGTLECRADDRAAIHTDGVFLKNISKIFKTSQVTLPDNIRLLAVRGENVNNPYGFLIRLSNGFVTDTHWKCSNTYHNNWYKPNYDDEDWQPAVSNAWPTEWFPHQLNPAEFIWARTYTSVVYCRGWPGKVYTS